MTRPTLSDLSPKFQEQARSELAKCAHPKTVDVGAMLPVRQVKPCRKTCASRPKLDAVARFTFPGLPVPVAELAFHGVRKWRFDAAWPDRMLAVEIDGGLFVNGGHSRGAARERDYEKDAHAMMLGWRVLRVSTGQVRSGRAAEWVRAMLAPKPLKQEPDRPWPWFGADHLGGKNDEA